MALPSTEEIAAIVGRDWAEGPYYDDAERSMDVQWSAVIWPLIRGYNFARTLDLAAGHGRNTAKLLECAGTVIAVDINQSNVDFLQSRFDHNSRVHILKNNGADLREVESKSISFVYSFDAMVHFDSDVVRSYIKEFHRIMEPGAHGFCHYSNNYLNPTGSYRDHPGWRNYMSRSLFEHWLAKEGFEVVQSRYLQACCVLVDKDDGNTDAVTVFALPA
jgi:ubiquinone/menaquinone biosynthesis C-methylase UbiE